ncbi:hypothetical protein NDU88_004940 [Pleurodeles waltl]|uniref:Complexin-2 n=1 Tax=Pleurodeles waltl TaxID=8319 RepID=A0AAV7PE15_PLEWA|nr:hypothetical protein NDU88_004940 [Pleurodeles waltl]
MGKMLGGEEEKDPDAQKKEEERQEALRQQEEERKAKHARMEAEREKVRQQIRDKYGLKKKEEKEAEEKAAMEQACEGSLTRPKKAIPAGCGDEDDEEEESILDTVLKYLPGPLQDMFKKTPKVSSRLFYNCREQFEGHTSLVCLVPVAKSFISTQQRPSFPKPSCDRGGNVPELLHGELILN